MPGELEKQIYTLAKIIFGEAGSEGGDDLTQKEESLKAVANVLNNRSLASGKSAYEEATKPRQFTAYWMPEYWKKIDSDIKLLPKTWAMAQTMARQVLDGTIQDNTQGATFYNNPKESTSNFFKGKTPHLIIGNHHFYKGLDEDAYPDSKVQEKLKQTQPQVLTNITPTQENKYIPFDLSTAEKYAYWEDVPGFNKEAKSLPEVYMSSPQSDSDAEILKQKSIEQMTGLTPEEKQFLSNVSIVSGQQYFNKSSMPYYTGSYANTGGEQGGTPNFHLDKPYIAFDKKLTETDIPTIQHELMHALPITEQNKSQRIGAKEEDWANNPPVSSTQQKLTMPSNIFTGTKKQVNEQEKNYPQQLFAAKATEHLQSGKGSDRFKKAFDAWVATMTPEQKSIAQEYLPEHFPQTQQSNLNPFNSQQQVSQQKSLNPFSIT